MVGRWSGGWANNEPGDKCLRRKGCFGRHAVLPVFLFRPGHNCPTLMNIPVLSFEKLAGKAASIMRYEKDTSRWPDGLRDVVPIMAESI